jgi:hypothetical protein
MIANDEIHSGEFRSANPHPTEITFGGADS